MRTTDRGVVMNRNDNGRDPAELRDIGEQNVERLLGRAYRPEEADAGFVQRLESQLCEVAREAAQARALAEASPGGRSFRFPWRLAWVAGIAAALVGPMLVVSLLP